LSVLNLAYISNQQPVLPRGWQAIGAEEAEERLSRVVEAVVAATTTTPPPRPPVFNGSDFVWPNHTCECSCLFVGNGTDSGSAPESTWWPVLATFLALSLGFFGGLCIGSQRGRRVPVQNDVAPLQSVVPPVIEILEEGPALSGRTSRGGLGHLAIAGSSL